MNFNVLDRSTSIHQNYLIEASAGCGKTFSIENLFIRLLLEGIKVGEILVVTFTKAGAADLRERIHQNLIRSIKALKGEEQPYDYLQKVLDEGEVEEAIKKLQEAYFYFDTAQVFTIHSFAARALSKLGFEADVFVHEEQLLSSRERKRLVNLFLKIGVSPHFFSFTQIKLLLKGGDLKQKLFKEGFKKQGHVPGKSYLDLFSDFKIAMRELKRLNYTGSYIAQDFETLFPHYVKMQEDDYLKAARFAALFDKLELEPQDFDSLLADSLMWVDKFAPANRKKKSLTISLSLHYPQSWEHFNHYLRPIVEEALSIPTLVKRMIAYFKDFLNQYKNPDERYIHDDFIVDLFQRLENPLFLEKIRSFYQAGIIDEFQDTDKMQWEIFSKIFLEGNRRLYLVGDPKQSIYSFRDADIYTYYKASDSLGIGAKRTLSKNFRASPGLVKCLNALFKNPFLPLPRLGSFADCPPVESSEKIVPYSFLDPYGPIHFVLPDEGWKGSLEEMEESFFFPFIAQEISKLSSYNQMACLVDDQKQCERLSAFLTRRGIPVALQRGKAFSKSSMIEPLRAVLRACLNPLKDSHLKRSLGSELIGWNYVDCLLLEQLDIKEEIVNQFFELQNHLNRGLEFFYPRFLDSTMRRDGLSVREGLLKLVLGKEKLNELDQLIEKLIESQASKEKLLLFLTDLAENEEELQFRSDISQNGVSILTMHIAKGLEFDVVFPIGLINRRKFRSKEITSLPIEEHDAEKMRLLYVALTRARQRVYFPIPAFLRAPSQGSFSLAELFFKGEEAFSKILELQQLAPFTYSRGVPAVKKPPVITSPLNILEPPSFQLLKQEKWIHSYSRLAQKGNSDFKRPPGDFQNEMKTPFTLPANKETGLLLHLLLEKIAFTPVNQPQDLLARIEPYLTLTPFADWRHVFADILFGVFNYEILKGLRMFEIQECMKEVEFVYPYENGYMKGVIDFLFKHEGKYYLVDWKSNWLEDYSPEKLVSAMQEEDYFLQAKIYMEAVRRYIGSHEIGGVFYYFLRGHQVFKVPL